MEEMGSSGSKATSTCTSSSSSSSFRKGRSKGHRGFQSYCLGTTSKSHDIDNDDQVAHFVIFLTIFFFQFLYPFLSFELGFDRYFNCTVWMSWFALAFRVREISLCTCFLPLPSLLHLRLTYFEGDLDP